MANLTKLQEVSSAIARGIVQDILVQRFNVIKRVIDDEIRGDIGKDKKSLPSLNFITMKAAAQKESGPGGGSASRGGATKDDQAR